MNRGRKQKTTEIFKTEVYHLVRDEYLVLGEYTGANNHITMIHTECGHEWETKPSYFVNSGRRCPKCFSTPKKDTVQFKREVYNLTGDEFTVLGNYEGYHNKILMKHGQCGGEWETVPSNFLRKGKCPLCSNRLKTKTQEQFKKEVYLLTNGEYQVIGKYENVKTKVKVKHNKCNHEYLVKPNDILHGKGCPKCRESRGEKAISKFIDTYNIKKCTQHKLKGCKDLNMLPFDLALFNNKLELLIEYDGKLHFEPVNHFGGHESFKDRIKKDKIKNQYCIDNDIPLIRIPYWEFNNIEYILKNVLIHYNLIENKNDTYDKEIVLKYLVDENWDHDKYIEMASIKKN